MIIFNDVDIRSVAPVRIEDIRVSPVALNPVSRPRAVEGGSVFVRGKEGTRTVTVTFAILEDNPVTRAQYIAAIMAWARTDKECKLQLYNQPGRYLSAVCTGFPEPSTRQWWESKLRLTFTCFDNPYWTDAKERSVPCGTAFWVPGDVLPLMRIECARQTDATAQTYTNGAESMTFSLIPAGSMVIDLNAQTAAVNGVSFMQHYAFTSSFIRPRIGAQTISGAGNVLYRGRWY